MRITIDTDSRSMELAEDGEVRQLALYSKEAFEVISRQWLKVGWDMKYPYTFSWLGRPIIQQPEDIVRIQEVVYHLKPDVIVETGVAHGGSLILYASLCKAMGKGRVIGIDIEIRKHNRERIEAHELSHLITLVEGSSVEAEVVERVRSEVHGEGSVLVLLDSDHSKDHVLAELAAYSSIVTPGSYIVATDGSMSWLQDVPRGRANWEWDNPLAAAEEFVVSNPNFTIEQPAWPFSESDLNENVTHWPGAYIKRLY